MPTAQVRPAHPADAAAIADVYRPYVLHTPVSFEQDPPGSDEMRRRMLLTPRLPWLVAARDDAVVGYAYASPHRARPAYRWSVEVSVYLAAQERGRGTGRLLYEHLLPELTLLGHVGAYAGITLPNEASVRLHESVGFTPVGVFRDVGYKHGRWHDVGWWQRSLRRSDIGAGDPHPPSSWEP